VLVVDPDWVGLAGTAALGSHRRHGPTARAGARAHLHRVGSLWRIRRPGRRRPGRTLRGHPRLSLLLVAEKPELTKRLQVLNLCLGDVRHSGLELGLGAENLAQEV
jgi:hypothetical protein